MVSVFLVFVAALSFFWGAFLFCQAGATTAILGADDLLVPLLFWAVSAVCFGSAAVLDGIRTATRKMVTKLDELAGEPS